MSLRILLAVTLAALPHFLAAETVDIPALAALDLKYSQVEAIDHYPGQPLAAQVSFRQGEGISLVTPHRVQQITYLVAPGETVEAKQPIATLRGPEIHHFMTEFDVTEQRLETAKKRFESNRALYQRRAIDEGRWIEISDAYYALQLEYEHMLHFRELLLPLEDDEDSLTLMSPAGGILKYRQDSPGIGSGEELALLVPQQALRLKVSVPLARRSGLASLAFGDCRLNIDSISGIASDFFVQAWSKPLDEHCELLPGQQLMVTPYYQLSAYRIPRSAVFQWLTKPTVLLRQQQQLITVPVELLSSDEGFYTVACPTDISGGEVLSTSVSAVQGVLMGLGGE